MYNGEEIKENIASRKLNILKGFSEVQELQKADEEWLGVKNWEHAPDPEEKETKAVGEAFDSRTTEIKKAKDQNEGLFLSAEDFETKRLNKSVFTNIDKGISETQFNLSYPAEKFQVFEKAVVENWIREVYEITGGDIVKGSFNDTEEVASILENMRNQVSLLKAVPVETEDGKIISVLVLPIEKAKSEGEEDSQDSLEKANLEDEGKSNQNEIEKGVYADNAQNRKLGRVGNKFGKEDDNSGAEAHNKKVQAKKDLDAAYAKWQKTDEFKKLYEHNMTPAVRKRHEEVYGKKYTDEEYKKEADTWMENYHRQGIYDPDSDSEKDSDEKPLTSKYLKSTGLKTGSGKDISVIDFNNASDKERNRLVEGIKKNFTKEEAKEAAKAVFNHYKDVVSKKGSSGRTASASYFGTEDVYRNIAGLPKHKHDEGKWDAQGNEDKTKKTAYQKYDEEYNSIKKAIDSDDEDSDSIEKGVIHDTVNYGNLDLSFAKTGAEIKDKLQGVVQEETAKLNALQIKLNAAEANQVYVPTENGYGSEDMTYKTYRWDMTYMPDDCHGSKTVKLSDTETGTLTQECCNEHREWNDLVYKFRDCKKELDTVNLLLRNLDDKKSYKLTARQMLDFGF